MDSPDVVTLPRVLNLDGARTLGFSDSRMRTELHRGRWRRIGPGVLLTRPESPTRDDWAHAGQLIAGPDSILSGWDAARSYGLGPRTPTDDLVLVLTHRGRCREIGSVRVRVTRRPMSSGRVDDRTTGLRGLRVASPERVVADTALSCRSLQDVRGMVTAAVQRGLCTSEALERELAEGPRNGSGLLRRAVLDVLGGARSAPEAEAVELLRSVGATGFLVNAPICNSLGVVIYVADVLWPELRAVLEIDSREFHFSEADWKRTSRRHNDLTAMGYAVTHYPPSDIRGRRLEWAYEVLGWLEARAAEVLR